MLHIFKYALKLILSDKINLIFGLLAHVRGFSQLSWDKICDIKLQPFIVHKFHFSTCHIPLITIEASDGLYAFSYTMNKTT